MNDREICAEINATVKAVHERGSYVTTLDIQRQGEGFEMVLKIRHPRREGDEWPADFFLQPAELPK